MTGHRGSGEECGGNGIHQLDGGSCDGGNGSGSGSGDRGDDNGIGR